MYKKKTLDFSVVTNPHSHTFRASADVLPFFHICPALATEIAMEVSPTGSKYPCFLSGLVKYIGCGSSQFTVGTTVLRTPASSAKVARRRGGARIFALGAAPPPPQESDGESGDAENATEAPDTVGSPGDAAEEVTADDILNSPSFLKKKLEIVQKELLEAKQALEKSEDAIKEEGDKYIRLAADFENYRRRSAEDLKKQDLRVTSKICGEVLTVLDNFDRAIKAVNPKTDGESVIHASYQGINKQLLEALTKLKVEPIDAVGELFDPELHEAIQQQESTEFTEGVVSAQFQRGYKVGDHLIRAAVVAVSQGPGPEQPQSADEDKGADDNVGGSESAETPSPDDGQVAAQ